MVKIHVLLHIACHRQRWHEVTPLGCYTWELKSLLFGKISGHNRIYKTCFSPLWVNRCLFRSPALLNDFSHCAHLCSLTPLWVSRCLFRSPACLNDLLHCPHLWGFSPLWVSRWVLRDPAWLNDLLHCPHLCTFSPVWVSKCIEILLANENDLTHMVQGCLLAIYPNIIGCSLVRSGE